MPEAVLKRVSWKKEREIANCPVEEEVVRGKITSTTTCQCSLAGLRALCSQAFSMAELTEFARRMTADLSYLAGRTYKTIEQ